MSNGSDYFLANWRALQTDKSAEQFFLKLLLWQKRHDPNMQNVPDEFFAKKAQEIWKARKAEWIAKGVDPTISALMAAKNFDEAERISRSKTIFQNSFSGSVFCLRSAENFQYTVHTHQIPPSNLANKNKPSFLHVENGKILAVGGKHELSDGELKKLITDRKIMHIHDFQKDAEWHLFFFTYRDVKGEHWETGHIHYCSSKWQTSKTQVLGELAKKNHSIRSVHLRFDMQ